MTSTALTKIASGSSAVAVVSGVQPLFPLTRNTPSQPAFFALCHNCSPFSRFDCVCVCVPCVWRNYFKFIELGSDVGFNLELGHPPVLRSKLVHGLGGSARGIGRPPASSDVKGRRRLLGIGESDIIINK